MKLPERLNRAALSAYKRRKQKRSDTSLDHCLAVAQATAERTPYCFLVTNSKYPWPTARWVEPLVEDDFVFYLGAHPQSRKVAELADDSSVTLAFGNESEHANLIIYGTATVHHDPLVRQQYWKNAWRMFFPHGPEGDDYCVIEVRTQKIELLSFSRHVIPEPFGLRPAVLEREGTGWRMMPH